jgi:hypothetical protein
MRPSFGKKGTPPTPGEPVSRLGKMLSQELDEETSFGDLPQLLMSIGKVCLALMGLALLLAVGLRIVGSFRKHDKSPKLRT